MYTYIPEKKLKSKLGGPKVKKKMHIHIHANLSHDMHTATHTHHPASSPFTRGVVSLGGGWAQFSTFGQCDTRQGEGSRRALCDVCCCIGVAQSAASLAPWQKGLQCCFNSCPSKQEDEKSHCSLEAGDDAVPSRHATAPCLRHIENPAPLLTDEQVEKKKENGTSYT